MSETDTAPPYLRFMLNAVLASLTIDSERDVADLMLERQAAAAMLAAFQVRNAIEAGLAAQAVTAFHAAMACFRRAALMDASQTETGRVFATARALSRTSLQMIRAIDSRRPAVRLARRAGPQNPFAAVMGQFNPDAKHAPGPQSGDSGPAAPPSPTVATAPLNPTQSDATVVPPCGRPVPPVIAGLDLTQPEQSAIACFAAALTSVA